MGTPVQKKFTDFFVVGYDWNVVVTKYAVLKSLANEISQKYQNSIHM